MRSAELQQQTAERSRRRQHPKTISSGTLLHLACGSSSQGQGIVKGSGRIEQSIHFCRCGRGLAGGRLSQPFRREHAAAKSRFHIGKGLVRFERGNLKLPRVRTRLCPKKLSRSKRPAQRVPIGKWPAFFAKQFDISACLALQSQDYRQCKSALGDQLNAVCDREWDLEVNPAWTSAAGHMKYREFETMERRNWYGIR
uniref:Uncharacterized protein n=1 Tax=Trichuris muris TaxID=70415 RepID=A0A5S6QHE1_TRIMR